MKPICYLTTHRLYCASGWSRSYGSSAPRASGFTSALNSLTTCRTRSWVSSGTAFRHALRAYTPRDQKAVNTAAETFVANPKLDVAKVISQLAVGEALVSTLQDKGSTDAGGAYPDLSATLPDRGGHTRRALDGAGTQPHKRQVRFSGKPRVGLRDLEPADLERESAKSESSPAEEKKPSERGGLVGDLLWGTKRRQGMVETLAKQAARSVGSQIGRQIIRGVLGGILGGSRRR